MAMTMRGRWDEASRWWYGTWVFLPLLWLIPSMLTENWPPAFTLFVGDLLACALGTVAAIRTARRSRQAILRVAAATLGTIYFLYLAITIASDVARLVQAR